MKRIYIMFAAVTLLAACSDEDFDINRDSDNLNEVSYSQHLPTCIAGIDGGQVACYALI